MGSVRSAATPAGKHYGHFDRMITLFWYLNDVEEGGETNFPWADIDKAPSTMKKFGLRAPELLCRLSTWYVASSLR